MATIKKTDTKPTKKDSQKEVQSKGRNIYYLSARKGKDGKKDCWEIKMENCKKVSALADTKDEAIKKAKELAGKKSATIIVRKVDGSIQETIKCGE
ncbi:MAG: DUF2188 domain-containing protein [Malacoplasma sp.]|nr:DUF2188 domain-containing protein [Malacoplasma sp.]